MGACNSGNMTLSIGQRPGNTDESREPSRAKDNMMTATGGGVWYKSSSLVCSSIVDQLMYKHPWTLVERVKCIISNDANAHCIACCRHWWIQCFVAGSRGGITAAC